MNWIYVTIGIAVCFGLTMLALLDTITKDFGSTNTKIFWHIIALIPLIGWLIYLIFGFRKGKRKSLS